ncbi:MAG: acyl-CoA dehydrogenase/oxidase [Podila humilis]|nr:MAG: acyl-CoA dehydrogenase/oxidase [Podila humilis]
MNSARNGPSRAKYGGIQEALSYYDNALSTMGGAHTGLYSGSIRELGSEELKAKYLPLADSFELPGCFALTELGHGSNTRGIETEAHWDAEQGCYIINTPKTTAQKYWIGAAAETAIMSIVWAQLYVPHPEDSSKWEHQGIHAFLVPLRDRATRAILPGITIRNCGMKSGLNGMDNGRIWFDKVKVPRTMCLDKYGGINEDGVYESMFQSKEQRFGGQLVNLSEGRVGLAVSSINMSKTALTIAIRYGQTRRQFGAKEVGQLETRIMDYNLHQRRLYPLLAQTYAMHFAARTIAKLKDTEKTELSEIKQFHVISSGLKSLHTWHLLDTLQATREACGGQGLKSSNRIGHMKADCDPMVTYEGDNQVMLITVAKGSLSDYSPKKLPVLQSFNKDKFAGQTFSDATLLSAEWQLDLFQHHVYATSLRLGAAVAKTRAALDGSSLSLDSILDQHAALSQEFARAVIEHWILNEFVMVEKQDKTGSMTLVRQLHALWKVDMDANMVRRRYVDEAVQERVRDLVGATIHRVHENVDALVGAFGVPDHLLGSIAGDWVEANEVDGDEDI